MDTKKPLIIFVISLLFISVASASILSFSEINVVSKGYKDLSGKVWSVSWVEKGYDTNYLRATIDPEDFNDKTGNPSKQPLTIEVTGQDQSCIYDIDETEYNVDVHELEPIKKHFGISCVGDFEKAKWENLCQEAKDWYRTKCWYKSPYLYHNSIGLGMDSMHCFSKGKTHGVVGAVRKEGLEFSTDWKVQAGNKPPVTGTISNRDTGQGISTKLGDNVWVEWQGNLGASRSCPSPQNNILALHNQQDGWKPIDYQEYQEYKESIIDTEGLKTRLERWANGEESKEGIVYDINRDARQAAQRESWNDVQVTNDIYANGKLETALSSRVVYPLFRLLIDADYLEMVLPVGEPQIVPGSVSDVKIPEGSVTGQVEATIRNVGKYEGSFWAWVSNCSQGFAGSTGKGFTLGSGQATTEYFPVTFSSTGDTKKIDGGCVLNVKETTSQERVHKDFHVTGIQTPTCTPDREVCSPDKTSIIQCKSNGLGYETVTSCASDEKCKVTAEGPECISKEEPPEPGPEPGPENCKTQYNDCLGNCGWNPLCKVKCWFSYQGCLFVNWAKTTLMYIGAFVGLIVVIFIIWQFVKRKVPEPIRRRVERLPRRTYRRFRRKE